MNNLGECQIPCLPRMAESQAKIRGRSVIGRLKVALAVPWNHHVKKWLKRLYHSVAAQHGPTKADIAAREFAPSTVISAGDQVRVRSYDEIASTLDPFKELKGCAFLDGMRPYCGTRQRVFKVMERFLDERDYKVKKVRGVILLENVICQGTPSFLACDRCCFLFWREEWLEKIGITESETPDADR